MKELILRIDLKNLGAAYLFLCYEFGTMLREHVEGNVKDLQDKQFNERQVNRLENCYKLHNLIKNDEACMSDFKAVIEDQQINTLIQLYRGTSRLYNDNQTMFNSIINLKYNGNQKN